MKVKIGFTIEPELLQEIDRTRGMTKRSTFLEHVIKLGLTALKDNETKRRTSKQRQQ